MRATAVERVIAQRPDPGELRAFRRTFDRELAVTWAEHAVNRYDIQQDDVSIYLGPELERTGELVRYLATIDTAYEGAFSEVLSIRPGGALPSDDGVCELGGVVSYAPEWYDFGATIEQLGAANFALSWEAAQWLYVAGRTQLDEDGVCCAITPRSTRLALFHRPYTASKKRAGVLGTNGARAPDAAVEHPPVFLFDDAPRPGTDEERALDRADLAAALANLTRHPDASVDRLLRDRSARDELRAILVQHERPLDPMLRDASRAVELAEVPLTDAPSIDDEIEAMWKMVLRLDPMIDTSDPRVLELPPPWIESIHGRG